MNMFSTDSSMFASFYLDAAEIQGDLDSTQTQKVSSTSIIP